MDACSHDYWQHVIENVSLVQIANNFLNTNQYVYLYLVVRRKREKIKINTRLTVANETSSESAPDSNEKEKQKRTYLCVGVDVKKLFGLWQNHGANCAFVEMIDHLG